MQNEGEEVQHDQQPEEEYSSSEDEWASPPKAVDGPMEVHAMEVTDLDQLQGEEKELAGDIVPIRFTLPTGETFQRNYVMGHTISYIKAQLEDLKGLRYEATVLKKDGKVLIDPLSLNDIPLFVPGILNEVEVVIN